MKRRELLAGALAAGAGAALASTPARALAAPPSATGSSPSLAATTFFPEPALNYQMLFALGAAGYGAAEVGEVLSTFDRIHAKGDTYPATYAEFLKLGRTVRARADRDRKAGRRESARGSYLRAAMYINQALFFALASKTPTRRHEGQLFREMEAAWASAGALFEPRFEAVSIPYYDGRLPGWFLSPGGKARRPTVIVNTGSDAQTIDMYVYGGAAALERGWNALIFEGPGQGANLFLHNKPFIPDWERVITPVVSWLREHRRVDRGRIALIGQSFGGYLVPRAAAHEHRLAAIVADPGVVDAFVGWRQALPREMLELLNAGKRREFDAFWDEIPKMLNEPERVGFAKRAEIYGNGSGYERMKLAQKFVLDRGTARRIECPTAITAPQLEEFFPGQSKTLAGWLKAPHRTMPFTIAEGAQYHCEPLAPQLRNERVFDWLEANVR